MRALSTRARLRDAALEVPGWMTCLRLLN